MSVLAFTLLLQGDPEPGFSFENLIQIAIVVIFFVLPGLKSLFEVRKRRGRAPGSAPPKGSRRPRELETQGRDLWREILGGDTQKEPAPRRPAQTTPVLRPKRPARERPAAQPPLAARPVRLETEPRPTPKPAARPAPRVERATVQRAAEQELGQLDVSVGAQPASLLEPSVRVRTIEDPATLDDELGRRWGASPVAPARPTAPTALGPVDWRRAVLLSELISPPLALRGPASAWPGPPAALSR